MTPGEKHFANFWHNCEGIVFEILIDGIKRYEAVAGNVTLAT